MASRAAVAEPEVENDIDAETRGEGYGALFTREGLNTSLSDLHTMLQSRSDNEHVRVAPNDVEFHLDATDPLIKFGSQEIPAEYSLPVVGDHLGVPSAFLKRASDNTSPATLNLLIGEMFRNMVTKDIAVEVNKTGSAILGIGEWGKHTGIRPVDVVEKVLPVFENTTADVSRLVDNPGTFAFDAHAAFTPEALGIGGDFAVDDLTAAGVRLEVNLKQGLTPSVQPYAYRRWCTNGMETRMDGLKIEGRGQTVEEVLAELEGMARLAFQRAEADIQHFYDLRNQPVDNPERAIMALARERGIPDRSATALLRLAPAEMALPDEPSMFDIVNLVTNFANNPAVRNDGGRLLLERAGGSVITDHAARCGHCKHVLN